MYTLKYRYAALATLLVAAGLTGCASRVNLDDVPVETRNPSLAPATPPKSTAAPSARPQSSVATVDLGKAGADVSLVGRVVYFDFDSYVVKDEFRPVVETHARSLMSNRQKKIVVEGHTDERGGREYNLALGQKRAEAVQKTMLLLGATDTQVEAVSYGEERPIATGSDENVWAKNRRAELRDR